MPKFYTYRFSNLPKHIDLSNLLDARLIRRSSLAPCPEAPDTFNVATVTFEGEPSFAGQLQNGLADLPIAESEGTVRVDADFYGITPLNSVSGSNVRADIIAITGLAGRAFESWQNENGYMWLRDFLPSHIPDVRVYIYGYPSKLQASPSRAIVQDFTEGLIRAILSVRKRPEEAKTPLILIGHSLGCILIKAAAVEAMSFPNIIPEIHQDLCGIVFFGAPHRGLDNPELESLLEDKPPAALVSDLRPESSLLINLNQRFPSACKHIRVISCYETHETPSPQLKDPNNPDSGWNRTGPTRFLVPRTSACLDWAEKETRIAVHANHSMIAKLDNTIGSALYEIVKEIGLMVDAAPTVVALRRTAFGLEDNAQLLDLFASLQYEHAWLVSWAAAASGVPPPRQNSESLVPVGREPTVSYGHPAYPMVAEAGSVLDSLARLLRVYIIPSADRDEELGSSSIFNRHSSSQVTLVGLPSYFQASPSTISTLTGDVNTCEGLSRITFRTTGWTGDEQARFSSLINHLRQVNETLTGFIREQASLDIIASATLLSTSAPPTEAMAHVHDRHSELSHRVSLQQQYSGPMQQEPKLFPLASINTDEGAPSSLSNYRVVSVLDDLGTDTGSTPANARVKPWVLVEWRSYHMARDSMAQNQAKEQAMRIAYDLGIQRKPTGLRTLDCIGLVQDRDVLRFGLLFKMPPDTDVTVGPITLHRYLFRDKLDGKPVPFPTLGNRIKLAHSLACSLAELHMIGILHKNFHSGNVLFFPARFTRTVSVREPYVGGFEVSRPEHDPSLSISLSSTYFDQYRHPELRDASNPLQGRPSSSRKYDVYGLGLVLLEIGLWQPLQRVIGMKASMSPTATAKRYVDIALLNLPHMMGPVYCDAVLDCIDIERQAIKDPSSLAEKVIKRLEQCQCQA